MICDNIIESLSRLIAEKPDLAEALQTAGRTEEAVEILAKAGAENGVAVDKAALAAYFAERAAANAKLSEADLDQVAGGGGAAYVISIFTLGFACAAVSINSAASGRDCKRALDNL